jgi:hypothetical protein
MGIAAVQAVSMEGIPPPGDVRVYVGACPSKMPFQAGISEVRGQRSRALRKFQRLVVSIAVLAIVVAAGPAHAIKIYLNPSDQTANFSPDNSYCEAVGLKDVARRLEAKLRARGFEVQNSDGGTMSQACNAANAWPADIFISMHSNAGAGPGWGKAHGTNTLYYQSRDGSPPNPISIELATRCDEKVVEKMTTYDRGHNFAITADLPFLGYPLYVLRKTNMPGTLVEGLFHDNMEDTAVLKTEEGRDAYAQGVYEAICDHFGWTYYPDSPLLNQAGPAANNADGRLVISFPGTNGSVWVCGQTGGNGAWSASWQDLKGISVSAPAVVRNASGRLDVFSLGTGSRIWHKVQASPGGEAWNGWYDLGGIVDCAPAVGINADGRLSVFAVAPDRHVKVKAQRSAGSLAWDNWLDLGGRGFGRPAVAANADARLAVFCTDPGGAICYKFQHAANSPACDAWYKFGGPASGDPVAVTDGSGRIVVFTCGIDSHIRYRVQKAPNSTAFDGWVELNGTMVGSPAVSMSTDGRFEVFARDTAGTIWHKSQITASGKVWSDWAALKGTFTTDPMIARNKDGRIEVFARGNGDGKMWRRVQREPGKSAIWDGWYPMGDDVSRF